MGLRVTLVQGGGVGYDQVPAVQRILQSADVDIGWDSHLAGLASLEQGGEALPAAMLRSVRETGLALKTKFFSPPRPPASRSRASTRRTSSSWRTGCSWNASGRPPGITRRSPPGN